MIHIKNYFSGSLRPASLVGGQPQAIKIAILIGLICMALIERLWWDLGDNVELITLGTFVAAFYINKKSAIIVSLISLSLSDIFLGNTSIMLFTWSAYLLIAVGAVWLKRLNTNSIKRILVATVGGVGASFFFYLWTNFGVWLLDPYQMYTKDLFGLIKSYVMGIPFLKAQLFSNVLIIFTVFTLIEIGLAIYYLQKQRQLVSITK